MMAILGALNPFAAVTTFSVFFLFNFFKNAFAVSEQFNRKLVRLRKTACFDTAMPLKN